MKYQREASEQFSKTFKGTLQLTKNMNEGQEASFQGQKVFQQKNLQQFDSGSRNDTKSKLQKLLYCQNTTKLKENRSTSQTRSQKTHLGSKPTPGKYETNKELNPHKETQDYLTDNSSTRVTNVSEYNFALDEKTHDILNRKKTSTHTVAPYSGLKKSTLSNRNTTSEVLDNRQAYAEFLERLPQRETVDGSSRSRNRVSNTLKGDVSSKPNRKIDLAFKPKKSGSESNQTSFIKLSNYDNYSNLQNQGKSLYQCETASQISGKQRSVSPCQMALNRANKSRLSMLTHKNNQNEGRRSSRSRSTKSQVSQLFVKRRRSKSIKNVDAAKRKNSKIQIAEEDEQPEKISSNQATLSPYSPFGQTPSIHIIQHPLLSPNHVQSIALNQHLQSIGLNLTMGLAEVSPSNPYKSYHDLTDKHNQLQSNLENLVGEIESLECVVDALKTKLKPILDDISSQQVDLKKRLIKKIDTILFLTRKLFKKNLEEGYKVFLGYLIDEMESNYKHKVLHLKMSASHTEEFDPWNFEVLEELSKFCQQILQELSEKKIYLIEIDNARSQLVQSLVKKCGWYSRIQMQYQITDDQLAEKKIYLEEYVRNFEELDVIFDKEKPEEGFISDLMNQKLNREDIINMMECVSLMETKKTVVSFILNISQWNKIHQEACKLECRKLGVLVEQLINKGCQSGGLKSVLANLPSQNLNSLIEEDLEILSKQTISNLLRLLDGFASLEEDLLEQLHLEDQDIQPEVDDERPEIDWLKFCFEICEQIGALSLKAILADVLEARDQRKITLGHLQLFKVIIELNRLAIQTKITTSVMAKLKIEEEQTEKKISELSTKPSEAKKIIDYILSKAQRSLEDDQLRESNQDLTESATNLKLISELKQIWWNFYFYLQFIKIFEASYASKVGEISQLVLNQFEIRKSWFWDEEDEQEPEEDFEPYFSITEYLTKIDEIGKEVQMIQDQEIHVLKFQHQEIQRDIESMLEKEEELTMMNLEIKEIRQEMLMIKTNKKDLYLRSAKKQSVYDSKHECSQQFMLNDGLSASKINLPLKLDSKLNPNVHQTQEKQPENEMTPLTSMTPNSKRFMSHVMQLKKSKKNQQNEDYPETTDPQNQKSNLSPVTTPSKEKRVLVDEDSAVKISKNLIASYLQNQANQVVVGAFGVALESEKQNITQIPKSPAIEPPQETDSDSDASNEAEFSGAELQAIFSRFSAKDIANRFVRKLMTQLKISGELGNNGFYWLSSIIHSIPIVKSLEYPCYEEFEQNDVSVLKISQTISQGYNVNLQELGYEKLTVEFDYQTLKFKVCEVAIHAVTEFAENEHLRETDRDLSRIVSEFEIGDIEVDEDTKKVLAEQLGILENNANCDESEREELKHVGIYGVSIRSKEGKFFKILFEKLQDLLSFLIAYSLCFQDAVNRIQSLQGF